MSCETTELLARQNLTEQERKFAEKMLASEMILDFIIASDFSQITIPELPTYIAGLFGNDIFKVLIKLDTFRQSTEQGGDIFSSHDFNPNQLDTYYNILDQKEKIPNIEVATIPCYPAAKQSSRKPGIIAIECNQDCQQTVEIDGRPIKIEHILPFVTAMTGAFVTLKHAESLGISKRDRDNLTLESLLTSLELHDQESMVHSTRVAQNVELFAFLSGINDPEKLILIRNSALSHDIGKLAVPSTVIQSSDRLTSNEYALMQLHTRIGAKIIKALNLENMMEEIIYQHHENYDGSGYPNGLEGDFINTFASITRIIDYFDALISPNRGYKAPMTIQEALQLMQEKREIFHPEYFDLIRNYIINNNINFLQWGEIRKRIAIEYDV